MKLLFNNKYKEIFTSDKRYKVLYGGAGSGKSYSICQYLITRLLTEKNTKILIIRKNYNTLKNSVYANIKNIIDTLDINNKFIFYKSPLNIICKDTNSQFLFLGIDDPEKLKSISNINTIFIEEASELTLDDFNQLDLRLRDIQTVKQEILLAFNPISNKNWTYKRFFENKTDNELIIKSNYLDNVKFLPKQYIDKLNDLKNIDEVYYNIYCLGEFGIASGLVFKPFKTIKKLPNVNFSDTFYGLDFGYNDPNALIEINFDIDTNNYYVSEKLYESKLTVSELIKKLKSIVKYECPIYCDSARPEIIEELRRNNLNAYKSTKTILPGINYIKNIHNNIFIDNNSNNLIDELNNYEYKKLKSGETLEEPIDKYNHLIDAMRYGFYSHANNKNDFEIDFTKNIKNISF